MKPRFFVWRWVVAVGFVVLSACSAERSVLVTVTGVVATEGGGYRVRLRNVDGTPIEALLDEDGVEKSQFVPFLAGAQEFGLVFADTGGLASVRIVVATLVSEDAPRAEGLGSSVVEVGSTSEISVELLADPRPMPAGITVRLRDNVLGTGRFGIVVQAGEAASDAFTAATDLSFHLWRAQNDNAPVPLGRLADGECNPECAFNLDTSPFESTTQSVLITAEPNTTQELVQPFGWVTHEAQWSAVIMSGLRPVREEVVILQDLLDHATEHISRAEGCRDSDDDCRKEHSEHIVNIIENVEDHVDYDDRPTRTTNDDPSGDDEGVAGHVTSLIGFADLLGENGEPRAIERGQYFSSVLDPCAAEAVLRADAIRLEGDKIPGDPSIATVSLLRAVVDLFSGDPALASVPDATSVHCLSTMWDGLSIADADPIVP